MTTNIDEKKEAAAEIKDVAVGEVAAAAESAKQQAGQVASTAKDEAEQLAMEAKDHAKALLDEGRQQVEEQSRIQRDRLVETLQSVGADLERMATSGQGGLAADLTRQVADRARQLSSSIEGREPAELVDGIKAFAQRKPGPFLLGALAAGVVAGRLLRGAKQELPTTSSTAPASGSTTMPLVATPQSSPVTPAVTSAQAVPAQSTGPLSSDTPLGGDLL